MHTNIQHMHLKLYVYTWALDMRLVGHLKLKCMGT